LALPICNQSPFGSAPKLLIRSSHAARPPVYRAATSYIPAAQYARTPNTTKFTIPTRCAEPNRADEELQDLHRREPKYVKRACLRKVRPNNHENQVTVLDVPRPKKAAFWQAPVVLVP
jgi:hypothetical protein